MKFCTIRDLEAAWFPYAARKAGRKNLRLQLDCLLELFYNSIAIAHFHWLWPDSVVNEDLVA